MSAFLDTNVVVRHLTGQPEEMARRATRFLQRGGELLLPDVVVAECVYVLESHYAVPRPIVGELLSALLAMRTIRVVSLALLQRTLELYERSGLAFVDAYLIASAELSGVGSIVSFDQELARHSPVAVVTP